MPQVVHSQAGSLYEEPLIACLAVTLERLEGLHVPTGTQSGASPLPKAPGPAGGAVGDASPGSRSHSGSPQGGGAPLGGILGRLLHRRANHKPGRRALTHSTSLSSVVSDDMLAGEDYGDECECFGRSFSQ